eukprot:scaffold2621_cov124-Isochrysis_galbana.AAC.5
MEFIALLKRAGDEGRGCRGGDGCESSSHKVASRHASVLRSALPRALCLETSFWRSTHRNESRALTDPVIRRRVVAPIFLPV